jgi:chemotaxis protein histidine kinase CheA
VKSIPQDQQIHALLNTQCDTLKCHVADVERLSLQIGKDEGSEESLKALIHVAHKIAGTGGTMGFDLLSQKAFALETFARTVARNPQNITVDAAAMIRALARSLSEVGVSLTPEHSRLRQRLLLRRASLRLEPGDQTR